MEQDNQINVPENSGWNAMQQQNQNLAEKKRIRASFWKGLFLGVFVSVCVALLGISIYHINAQKVLQRLKDKENTKTAEEVVVNERIQQKMNKIAKLIDEYYYESVDTEDMEDYLYRGLLAGTGDLYSTYYSKKELDQFVEDASGSYSGIGVTMQYDSAKQMVKIVKVNEKGPAKKAGIKEGDYIYKVEGEVVVLENANTTDLVSKVRGEEGTKVRMTMLRGDDAEEIEVEVERKQLEVETVLSQMLEEKIGYIQITEFEGLTSQQFDAALQGLEDEGAKALIVDLRGNPGGQVDSVTEIAENFLPEGIITYMEDKYGNRKEYTCNGEQIWDKPLVVLMDGNSASASEILAGAIRDHGVGTLIGTKSYGKGIVQQTIDLGDGTAIKLTFAKYYTPKGENIHKKGIEPDVEVEYEAPAEGEEYKIEEDNQVAVAVKELKKQMSAQ